MEIVVVSMGFNMSFGFILVYLSIIFTWEVLYNESNNKKKESGFIVNVSPFPPPS